MQKFAFSLLALTVFGQDEGDSFSDQVQDNQDDVNVVVEETAATEAEEEQSAAEAWYDNVMASTAEDAVTVACLCYDELSTWDLRPMSLDGGEYTDTEDGDWTYLGWNPCAFINFAAVGKPEATEQITHGTFAYWNSWNDETYVALTREGQWKANTTTAMFPLNDDLEVDSYDEAIGLRVQYESADVCGDGFTTFTLEAMCDEAIGAGEGMPKVAAQKVSTDLSGCDKRVTYSHNAGCSIYSALGFVNFMAENVWLSGTLLLVLGLLMGLFGQRFFLPLSGLFGGMCAFIAFMVFASIFQWLNTTVGLIICFIFAVASGVLVYMLLATQLIATMFLCIGGGFLVGSIIEGLVIAISGWESLMFYIIVTACFMVGGGILGCQKSCSDNVTKYLTASVGSYIFMRGWTFFLGGFPSEMEMYNMMANENSDELAFTGLFWFYVALWVGGVVLFAFIQTKYTWAHKKDDNFKPAPTTEEHHH